MQDVVRNAFLQKTRLRRGYRARALSRTLMNEPKTQMH
jgi:hypothetical protein